MSIPYHNICILFFPFKLRLILPTRNQSAQMFQESEAFARSFSCDRFLLQITMIMGTRSLVLLQFLELDIQYVNEIP